MPRRHPQLELDAQLCFPLYAASRAMVRAYGPLLDAVGLTYPQYLTMLALWGAGDTSLTVGELGARLRLDSGTLTPLLKRLEGEGYVHRHRDPNDERRVLLDVTADGWALRERVTHVPAAVARAGALDVADAHELRRLLDLLLAHLDDHDPRSGGATHPGTTMTRETRGTSGEDHE
jgi:DNA-binding MarR family transcriptional regulator